MAKEKETTTLAEVKPQALFTREQVDLIRKTIAKDCSDNELQLFLYHCQRTKLDPFSRQIYAIKRDQQMVIQTSIDGYRVIADRTGQYAGNDDPIFDSGNGNPVTATVTVWKLVHGQRCPFSATARWDEYYPGKKLGFMWDKMPFLMLGKVAEALALRKAFPADLSGLYTKEEMDQADRGLSETKRTEPKNGNGNGKKKTDFKKFLDAMEKCKADIVSLSGRDKAYYTILGSFGFEHANQIKDREQQETVYKELKEAIKTVQEEIKEPEQEEISV